METQLPTEMGTATPTFRPMSTVAKQSPILATAELFLKLFYNIMLITIFIKGALKIACLFNFNPSASGKLRSPAPYPGLRPSTPLEDFHFQALSCVQYDFQTILSHSIGQIIFI